MLLHIPYAVTHAVRRGKPAGIASVECPCVCGQPDCSLPRRVRVCVCVCVTHLNRCKTSTDWCKTSTTVKGPHYIYIYIFFYAGFISSTHVHLRLRLSSFPLGRLVRSRFYCSHLYIYIYQRQGAAGTVIVLQPTKTAMTFCDIDPGRWIDVLPASFHVPFLQWDVANPRTTSPLCISHCVKPNQTFRFRAVSFQCLHGLRNLFTGNMSLFLGWCPWLSPVRFTWIVFARTMHSTSKFARTVLSKYVCV